MPRVCTEWRDPGYVLDAYNHKKTSIGRRRRDTSITTTREKLTAVLGSCIGYPHKIASRRQPATHRIRRHFIVPYHLPSRQIIHTLALPGFYTAIAHYTLRYGVKATFPALFEVFDYVDGGLGSIPCL